MSRREWGLSIIALGLVSILMGVGCFCLGKAGPSAHNALDRQSIAHLGLFCAMASLGAFMLLAWVCRAPYYVVQLEGGSCLLALPVVQEVVCAYWKNAFPQVAMPQVICEKQQIMVTLLEKEIQPSLLQQIESELGPFIKHHIGCDIPIILTVR